MIDSAKYSVENSTRASRIALPVLALVVVALALAPLAAPRSVILDLFFVLYLIVLAQCWNLLAGYGGLVSVGQQAYVGAGAYFTYGASILLGLDPLAAVVVAGIAGAALSIPTALVVFRLQGAYFAIGTWVAAEVYRLIFAQWKDLGGGTGTSLPSSVAKGMAGVSWTKSVLDLKTSAARDVVSYWFILALAVLVVGASYWFLRSRRGLALSAIRDNQAAAESVGVDVVRSKMAVYVFASFGAALAGGIIFFQKASITPDSAFSVIEWTAFVFFVVVIGGIGTLEGPIIGAIILFALQNWLSDYATWYLILLGAVASAVMLVAPKGIWGFVQAKYDFSIFPTRRRLIGPDTPVPDYTRPVQELAKPEPVGIRGSDIRLEEPMFDIETEVLIVGSGPAGGSAAALLSAYGVPNVMIEKYSWLANTPRAHITNQRTMEILRELGIEEDAIAKSVPQELMGNNVFCTSLAGEEIGRLLTWGNHPSRRADYDLASPCRICDIPQTLFEPIVVGKAMEMGTIARFKTEYVSHSQDASSVVATVRDRVADQTYRIRSKYMIGADGAKSAVAEHLGLPMEGRMGIEGSMNIEFEADLSRYVAHRPSVLYWVFQPGSNIGGIGAGVIRMVRPWNKWLSIYGYLVEDGPPELSDADAERIVRQLVGDDEIPIKITRKSFWTVNNMSARRFSKGRVFCMGDAVHRHPPSNGLGSNTSVQDAYNFGWKLKLVLDGKAGESLLDTYNEERQPIGRQIVARANKSIDDYKPIFETLGLTDPGSPEDIKRRMEARKQPTIEAEARRKALNRYIRRKSYEFNCHGVELGQRYASQAVIPDGTPEPEYARDRELYYHPTTWPGAHLPHVWVEARKKRVSTIDLAGRGRFTLFTGISGAGWVEAGARAQAEFGVEIRVIQIGPGCEVSDTFGDWALASEVGDSGCVLVRPDCHVCWRRRELAANPSEALAGAMRQILARR
ncbi:MAG: FAD-dependent monooxygenase [Albidovulum sp.]|nr:FAD-dependent monooxygenase [Albidovulum sp.]